MSLAERRPAPSAMFDTIETAERSHLARQSESLSTGKRRGVAVHRDSEIYRSVPHIEASEVMHIPVISEFNRDGKGAV